MGLNDNHQLIRGLLPEKRRLSGPAGRRAGRHLPRRALLLALGVLMAGTGVVGAAGLTRARAVVTVSSAAAGAGRANVAATVPGLPGTPQAPTVLFSEDFENNPNSTTPVLLNEYVGASGETYTADPPWLTNCNGIISSFSLPPSSDTTASAPWVALCSSVVATATPGASAWDDVRNLAYAMGVVNGTPDPATNHAVSAFTNGANPGANLVEFQTVEPIPVSAAHGRFLTFSVNAAEMSCAAQPNHAMLEFFLLNGTEDIPTFTSPIEPCLQGTEVTTPGPVTSPIFAGRFISNSPVLFTGTSLGIQMRNAQGSGLGNDHAFDDIQVLDVTPQLDKSFSPASVPAGGTSALTFTITNTSDLNAKDGWSFTDTLPPGLVLATPSAAATTCPAGVVTAPDGGSSVSVTGDLDAGEASCTVTVNVTSPTPGTFTNDASNITSSTGLNLPGSSAVTFTAPAISLVKSVTPSSFPAAGTLLHYSFVVTNTGDVTLTDVHEIDTDLPGLSVISCPSTTLEAGKSQTCTATYTTTQAGVSAGRVINTATAQGLPPGTTVPVTSKPSTAIALFRPFVPVTG